MEVIENSGVDLASPQSAVNMNQDMVNKGKSGNPDIGGKDYIKSEVGGKIEGNLFGPWMIAKKPVRQKAVNA